MSIEEQLL